MIDSPGDYDGRRLAKTLSGGAPLNNPALRGAADGVTPAVAFAGATGSPEAVSSRAPVGVNRLVKVEFVFGGARRSGRRRRARGRDDQPGTRLPTSCIAAAGRCTEAPQIGSANDRKGATPEAADFEMGFCLAPRADLRLGELARLSDPVPPLTLRREAELPRIDHAHVRPLAFVVRWR